MKRALRTILFGLLFSSSVTVFGQDPELTQFYAAPVYTNPALAGSAVCQTGAAGPPGGRVRGPAAVDPCPAAVLR